MIGDIKDAAFIAAVLAIDAVIGTKRSGGPEKSRHALKKLLRSRPRVMRAGEVGEVWAEQAVPGDVVWLHEPTRRKTMTESILTGETDRAVSADVPIVAPNATVALAGEQGCEAARPSNEQSCNAGDEAIRGAFPTANGKRLDARRETGLTSF